MKRADVEAMFTGLLVFVVVIAGIGLIVHCGCLRKGGSCKDDSCTKEVVSEEGNITS